MNEVLLGSLVDKIDTQDRKIEDLNKKIDQIPAYEELLSLFKTAFEGLLSEVQKISFPEKEIFELSERLVTGTELLRRPVEQKIIHRHHLTNNCCSFPATMYRNDVLVNYL